MFISVWIILLYSRIYPGYSADGYLPQKLMTKLNNDMKVEKINHNDVGQLKREGLSALINNGEIDVHCDKTGPRKARFSLWVGERDMHNLCHHHQITNTPQYSYSNPLFSSHYGQYQQPPYQYDPNRQSSMYPQQSQYIYQKSAPPNSQTDIFQYPQSYMSPEHQQYAPPNRANPTNQHTQAHMSADEHRLKGELEARPVEDDQQREIDHLRKEIELLRSELGTAREQLVQCHLEHRTLHSQREEEEEKKDIARATAASMEQMQRTVDDLASRKQHAVQMAASMDHGMVETDMLPMQRRHDDQMRRNIGASRELNG
mmetsp:Transcript_57024/g.51304  ORF Transcript_57024/g.51304 Transcript_57024/m.51304 type:complete len:316 (+) Transcript_57024:53-1000(+)